MLSLESAVVHVSARDRSTLERSERFTRPDPVPATDSPLVSAVRRRLAQSGRPELRTVRVTAEPDGVRLQGRVSSYYLKQLAQASALAVDGVTKVRNELAVC